MSSWFTFYDRERPKFIAKEDIEGQNLMKMNDDGTRTMKMVNDAYPR